MTGRLKRCQHLILLTIIFMRNCSSLSEAILKEAEPTPPGDDTNNFTELLTERFALLTSKIFIFEETTTEQIKDKEIVTTSSEEKLEFTDYYEIEFTNPLVTKYGIETAFCETRYTCSRSIPEERNCKCDLLCQVLNDCCRDSPFKNVDTSLEASQLECKQFMLDKGYRKVLIVSKCPENWANNITRTLCEANPRQMDLLSQVPVSDMLKTEIIYKNMFCAHCNNVFDFNFWTVDVTCFDPNITSTCLSYYKPPNGIFPERQCGSNGIATCPDHSASPGASSSWSLCETEPAHVVFSFVEGLQDITYTKYKNQHCAVCNGVQESLLLCEEQTGSLVDGENTVYSYRVLVDFNKDQRTFSCLDNELYDPFAKICREVFCPDSMKPFQGRCVPAVRNIQHVAGEVDRNKIQCTFVKLDDEDWQLLNDSVLFVPSLKRTFNESFFHINGTDVFLCSNDIYYSDSKILGFLTCGVEIYLTLVGSALSIIALCATSVVYLSFKELLNIPGKILVCLSLSLLAAQVLFLVLGHIESLTLLCKVFAVSVHYFFIASFCWMNAIGFDLHATFSRSFVKSSSNSKSKRFYFYSLYGWLVPIIFVVTAVVFDNIDIADDYGLKPNYGKGVCWISNPKALLTFFVIPLGVFKAFDIVVFTSTSIFIARANRQGSKIRDNKTCTFILYLKISLIMGLTWVFAFVAVFGKSAVLWYLFIVFNSLQGVFIALSFLCSRKVKKLILLKLFERQDTKTSASFSTKI